MTRLNMNPDNKRQGRDPWSLAGRGSMGGGVAVASLLALAWLTGMIPERLVGTVCAGVLVASLSCSLGIVFKAFALTSTGPGVSPSQLLQIAILGDFVLQLLVLGGILLGMYLLGMKFASTTIFALTYAGVVFVFPIVATLIFGKEIRRQANSSGSGAAFNKKVQDIPSS